MYLLFAGDHYYPSGGWSDLKGRFSSKEEALEFYKAGHRYGDDEDYVHYWDWYQIVDMESMEVIDF
jgi:hypothetical protein